MEAFSLLKYWRRGGGVTGNNKCTIPSITTVAIIVQQPVVETDDDNENKGSFFDLEFTIPDDDNSEGKDEHGNNEDEEDDGDSSMGTVDGEGEFNFTVSSGSSSDNTDPNLWLSPSDDLFFKGRFVPFKPSSLMMRDKFKVSVRMKEWVVRVYDLKFKTLNRCRILSANSREHRFSEPRRAQLVEHRVAFPHG